MKRIIGFVGSSISKSIPFIGIGSEIKENLVKEIKAAAICVFLFGFAACIFLFGAIALVLLPSTPGYGLGLIVLSGLIVWPSWVRLKLAKERIDAVRPLIESAQKVSQIANTAFNTVSEKADVAVDAVKGFLNRFKKNET